RAPRRLGSSASRTATPTRRRAGRTDRNGRCRTATACREASLSLRRPAAGRARPVRRRASLASRVGGIPHLADRMRLRHQPLEVVDEALAAVFGILIVASDMDRFFRTHLLAVAAEDAAELVDLEHERIAIAILVLAGHELDAVGRADRRTESAGDALGLAVLGCEHAVRPPPTRRERPFLLGILNRDLVRIEQMLERERHALEGRPHVARLCDRALEHFYADRHQSAPP